MLDTTGVPLELGRTHRLVSAHLRTALTERTVFIAPDGLPTFIPPKHVDPLQRPQRNKYHRRQ